MSRKIPPKDSLTIAKEEAELWKTENAKLLFTTYRGRNCALTIQNNRLMAASFFPQHPSKVGAIYIGKVKNKVKNLDVCFVEISGGELCFLSLKNISAPFLLNRNFDGRILEGDELLVQVIRDAQKSKRACLTMDVSLSNDCFVLTLGSEKAGFSFQLSKERKNAIKKLLTGQAVIKNGLLVQNYETFLPETECCRLRAEGIAPEMLKLPPIGMIVRTMAGDIKNNEELLNSFYELYTQFVKLLSIAMHRNCFCCLKQAPMAFETVVQQFIMEEEHSMENVSSMQETITASKSERTGIAVYNSGNADSVGREIITDQESMFDMLKDYCEEYRKQHPLNLSVRLYQDDMLSLSMMYSIDSRLEAALGSRIWLKSGGYLIIEPTEALTVIDVNSGKCEWGRNPEETYRKINLEAAYETAIQLKLRNLSGIIIIDFINMESAKDRAELLSYLRILVKRDKIPTTVVDMTPLGLVEITRKKINKPLREQFLSETDAETSEEQS